MPENYAEQARRMREWMAREGMEAHVEKLPDGRVIIVPGPKTDRARQAAWDAKNLITVSCRVPIATAEAFREACHQEGYSPYAVLRRYVEVIVREHQRVTRVRASARPGGPPRSSARLGCVGGEREDRSTAGTPRGRPPRAPWSVPSGLRKPEPRQAYDWQKETAP